MSKIEELEAIIEIKEDAIFKLKGIVKSLEQRIRKHPCLYCGKEMEQHYDDYTPYYECYCPDAKLKRAIKKKIRKLELEIPQRKFEFVQKDILVPNKY